MIQTTAKEYIKNPYPGIRSFDTIESSLFFGREKHTYELLKVLTKSHFIVISGASGSGKSSLVKAGLIPELKKVSQNWSSISFRPGNQPLANMSDALFDLFQEYGVDNKQVGNFKDVERILKKGEGELLNFFDEIGFNDSLLIYVDQFEEIFRYRDDEYISSSKEDSEYFVNLLVELSKQRARPVFVVLSMRTDFLSDCTEFAELPDMINDGHYLIPKMTLEEKEEVVHGPARYAGAEISEELSDLLRKHILEYDISLPVLQHALMRTWEYWLINAEQDQAVDVEHYKAIGTVTDALSVHAEQIYGSLPNKELKLVTEKLFKSLTHLGEDNRGTRRPARLDEICKITGAHEEDVIAVIDEFRAEGNSFLMPVHTQRLNSSSIIDISHESIMRVWIRLVEWVNEETESAQLYLRLSKSAELYQEGKTGLLVNPDLQLALKWQQENKPNETWALRYDPAFERTMAYLEYSRKEFEKAAAAREERQKRNLRRTRYIAIFLGAASIISISFLIVALNLKIKAEASEKKALSSEKIAVEESKAADEQKKEAISHKKIAEQQQMIANEERRMAEEQKVYALLQRKEAIYQKSIALQSKNEAVIAKNKAEELQIEAERLRDSALVQKKRAEEQKIRAEYSEARTDTLRRLAIAKSLSVQALKVYQNNKKAKNLSKEQADLPLILAYQAYYFNKKYHGNAYDPDIYAALSEVSNSSINIRGQNIHTDAVRDVAVSTDGKYFVSCSDDGSVKKFNFSDPENPVSYRMPKNDDQYIFRAVAIDQKDDLTVAGTYDGKILVWSSPQNFKTMLLGHKSSVNQLLVLQKTGMLISVSNDGFVRSWKLNDFQSSSKIVYQSSEKLIACVANANESKLAVGSENGTVRIFNTSDYSMAETFQSKEGKIYSLDWIENGDLLIGYASGKIEMRKNGSIKSIFAHVSGVNDIQFDNQNKRMLTCGYDGKVKIWDYNNLDAEPAIIDGHNNWVYCLALSADNSMVLSGGADKGLLLSKINIEDLKTTIRKNVSANMSYKNWLNYVGQDIDYFKKLPDE